MSQAHHSFRVVLTSFAFIYLCTLLLSPLPSLAQDSSSSSGASDSSTGDLGLSSSSSSTGPEDVGNFSSSSTGGGNYTGNVTSSTGAAGPSNTTLMPFDHYVCGYQYINSTHGYYLNGADWETPGYNYLDQPTDGTINATYRGYPQCYGAARDKNCFDQFAASPKFPFNRFCTEPDANIRFVKGDPLDTPLCLVFGGGNRMFRIKFYPKVDEFALVQVQGSFNSTVGFQTFGHIGTAFQVELNGQISTTKHRYSYITDTECRAPTYPNGTAIPGAQCQFSGGNKCTVVPFHTIIIRMDNGVLSAIDFDDDCSLCSSDYCVDGNCAQAIDTCTNSTVNGVATGGTTDCDFKLYVSWDGTDSQGTYLSSSGRRLSQFRRWSLRSLYNQASTFSTDDIPIAEPDTEAKI